MVIKSSHYGSLNIVRYCTLCIAFFALASIFASCDVHQFPDPPEPGQTPPENPDDPEDPDYPDDPSLYVDLNLDLEYSTEMYLWEHYYDPKTSQIVLQYPESNIDGNHPGTSKLFEGRQSKGLKFATVRFSRKGNISSHVRFEEFFTDITDGYEISLPIRIVPGDYDIVVWSDMKEAEANPRFYDPSSFYGIKIDYDNFTANTDYRDSFRGRASISLGEEGGSYTVQMYRPMAKYEFVTTDLSEFLDNETIRRNLSTRATMDDYDVKIHYSTYHPSTYNAIDDWLTDSNTGINFTTEVTITGESEASLGYDYVFINDTDSGAVQTTIVVYDKAGNLVTQSVQLSVPLRRDHHTLLRGAFLTMNGNGGVGIDPGYNGDHNIMP